MSSIEQTVQNCIFQYLPKELPPQVIQNVGFWTSSPLTLWCHFLKTWTQFINQFLNESLEPLTYAIPGVLYICFVCSVEFGDNVLRKITVNIPSFAVQTSEYFGVLLCFLYLGKLIESMKQSGRAKNFRKTSLKWGGGGHFSVAIRIICVQVCDIKKVYKIVYLFTWLVKVNIIQHKVKPDLQIKAKIKHD